MNKRTLLVMVVAAILLVGCGGGPDAPPLVYLVSNGNLVDGFQSSYCWDRGMLGTLCVDSIEPAFDSSTSLPANAPIQIQLDMPLPNTVTLSLSREVFGETILSASVPVTKQIRWSPAAGAGAFILTVHVSWKQGDVSYWFSIALE